MKEMKRKTKIVGTIGPASESKEILRELMKSGLDVARINFSHGGYEENKDKIDNIKAVREELNLPVALMLDTKGPEIRTGKQESGDEKVEIKEGSEFTFVNDDIIGNETKTSISYKNLYNEVKPGAKILVDDGAIEFRVKEIRGKDVVCTTINTGLLGSRKTVNVPGLSLELPAISEKDRVDILNGIKANFDFIAASFVRRASDVKAIRQLLDENGGEEIKIISKIESQEGIDNIDEIIEVSDGIMVARGDMAVEIPFEKVPIVQKNFVKRCNRVGKPVIIATQMLETMMNNPRPTRAEVSDVANAVYDETNAIMLSGECAIGKFPLECIQTMNKIATSVDNDMNLWKRFTRRAQERGILNPNIVVTDLEASIAKTTCVTALQINADAIAAYTHTGSTVTRIAGLRPKCPIIAMTDSRKTYHQLSVSWNVYPVYVEGVEKAAKVLYKGIEMLKKDGFLEEGDTVLLSGGPRTKVVGETESKVLGGVVRV